MSRCSTDSSRSSPVISRASSRGGRAGGVDGDDPLAVAQHRDPVADLEHLVELVRDEHDRAPAGDERPHDVEQLAGLGRREHGGRLVEDQDPRAPGEDAEDLDALLLADRQLPDLGLRVDAQPELVHQLRPCGRRRSRRVTRRGVASQPRWMFSATVIGGDELEVLVHHPDAGGDGLGGRVELLLDAVDLDRGRHRRGRCRPARWTASSCRRRSRPAARGPRRGAARGRRRTRAGTPSKLLEMLRTTTAGAPDALGASPASAVDAGHTLDGPVDEVRLLGVQGLALRQPLGALVVDDRAGVRVQRLVEQLRAELVDGGADVLPAPSSPHSPRSSGRRSGSVFAVHVPASAASACSR